MTNQSIAELLTPVDIEVFLTSGESHIISTDTRWADKLRHTTVHPFSRRGEFILFITKDANGDNPNPKDKNGMSVPHYLTGRCNQYHYRDNDPFNCTTSNFGSRHEKHTNSKHN